MRLLIAATAALLIGGCASLPSGYERPESFALPDTTATALSQRGREALLAHPGESGCLPLPDGVDALAVRVGLAEATQRSLDVQYCIWHDDLTGRLFTSALLRAADRGVRVRILVDDVGAKTNDDSLLSLAAHPHIRIRLFNPVAKRSFRGLGMLTDFSRTNRRMHNKAFIADNQRAVVGGRNIGNEYFAASDEVTFTDLDVVTLGPIVNAVSQAFDLYWNAPMTIPIGALTGRRGESTGLDALREQLTSFVEEQADSPYVRNARSQKAQALAEGTDGVYWGRVHLLVDDPAKVTREPEDTEGHISRQLGRITGHLRDELLIVSPYFVPGDIGVTGLGGLVKKGVKVTVLTNSLAATDVGAVHAGYKKYREALLAAGIRLYELKPDANGFSRPKGSKGSPGGSRASLHAKTFVFDRRAVFIGSLNLDPRSVQLNTEIGVVCENPAFAGALAGGRAGALDRVAWRVERIVGPDGSARLVWNETTPGGVTQLQDEPGVSAWRQLGVWFLGLLPIESQL
jgi:putative cardiolipin synthase